ncbi:hypothetical protein SJAV_20510 [Sulfurisphaera javensis]|uniref:Uncharacterized protein n=1 Tax=Sulfurisphaera javensis TaxID=2049879 RepID=A0AAT9GU39_9CREN
MANQIYLLIFVGLLTSLINIILQYLLVKIKMKKIENEWITLKSIASLSSFKNYLDVVSADEAQELLEELLVGLRMTPSIDLLSNNVEEKLKSLKGGLKALLDSLNITDLLNAYYISAKKSNQLGMIMSYISLLIILLSIVTPLSLFLLGVSLGLGINSLYLLLNSYVNIEKIEKIKRKLKTLLLE